MAVRSTQIVCDSYTATGGVDVLYTVPTDRTLIVKDVRVRDVGAGCSPLLLVDAGGGNLGHILDVILAAGAFHAADPPPWVVLLEGDSISWFAAAGSSVRWLISGALLYGDPT